MPTMMRSRTIWPTRVHWPREEDQKLPALLNASPRPSPYVRGRSRFALSPLRLTLDQLLFVVTAALLAMGLIMVQSADARIRGVNENWLWTAFSNKNAIHAGVALAAMTLMWRLDYRWLLGRKLLWSPSLWLLVGTFACLAGVLVAGHEVNGARRWLTLGPISFQPSELAKLCLVLFVSMYAVHCRDQIQTFGVGMIPWLLILVGTVAAVVPEAKLHLEKVLHPGSSLLEHFTLLKYSVAAFCLIAGGVMLKFPATRKWTWGFVPLVVVFGGVCGLVLKEDFGTTVLIASVAFLLIFMAGCRWWHVGLLIPPAAFGVWAILFHDKTSFRYKRLLAFLDPSKDPQGAGFHLLQSLGAIRLGGFFGRGLGNGIQKMGFLPEDNTDFIFAVICEELGLLGAFIVAALFITFVFCGWRIMSRCENLFGKMVAFGITATIGLQAAINIAVVTASMPTKGIALPLISSGGTGWIMTALAIGVLMSIERINRKVAAQSMAMGDTQGMGFPVDVRPMVVEPVAESTGGAA